MNATESRLLSLAVFGRGNQNRLLHRDNDQGVQYKVLSLLLGQVFAPAAALMQNLLLATAPMNNAMRKAENECRASTDNDVSKALTPMGVA
jgi:hypothetical protein